MKTSLPYNWSNTGCLYKLCSRWPGPGSHISYCVLRSQTRSVYSSGKLRNNQFCKLNLLSGISCVARCSYSTLTRCRPEVCSVLLSCNNIHVTPVQTTSELHTMCSRTVLRKMDRQHIIKDVFNLNHSIWSRKWSRSSRPVGNDEENSAEDTDKLEHRKRMQRLSADNDMLSRFRNTYIMTLVCLASLQCELTQLQSTIAAVAIATSELNLTFGTVVYISNLIMLHRSDKISAVYFFSCLVFALTHFILWTILLGLIFPTTEVIDEELTRYLKEN